MSKLLSMIKSKGMPSRYQEVEYIESNGTQYIDTEYIANGNITFDTEIKTIENTGSYLFGGGTWYNIDAIELQWYSYKNRLQLKYGNSAMTSSISDTAYQDKFRIYSYIENGNYYTKFTNTDIKSTSILSFSGQKIILFGTWFGGQPRYLTSQRIYYFKLYDNNKLIRNFIPVYNTLTQKYGMWENVQRKFYENDGTGDFAGA